jgi:hypothetical protein
VKLDAYEQVEQEALRFRTFIQTQDRDLHPEIHLHAGAALIIFDIIAALTPGVAAPAPSLGSVLNKYWSAEIFQIECKHDANSIVAATVDAAERLAALNKQSCNNATFEVRANPHISCIKELESTGFDWGFSATVLQERARAEAILQSRATAAVSHGDAHVGNVLIRDRYGHLIDYAYSGPGHPCADLAKLELSIFFQSYHPFGSETALMQLQRDLTDITNDLDSILRNHASIIKSRTNELCLRLCFAVRNKATSVLVAHNLGPEHYWAAKVLQAWQSLQISNLPQSLVRMVIQAISRP